MGEEEKKGTGEKSDMKKEDVKEVFTRVLKKLKGK